MIIGGWRGPGWRVVDADPVHGKQVRDWIRSVITRHECPVDPADTALAVSELYANAVMHGTARASAKTRQAGLVMHDEHPVAHRRPVFVLADPPARLPLMPK